MRTDEGKITALHERANQIEHQRAVRIARIVSVAGIAVCLAILVTVAMVMPRVLDQSPAFVLESGMNASVFASGSALGFIVIGAMAFILGILVTLLCYKLKRWSKDHDREY